jgi:hypothetical protein
MWSFQVNIKIVGESLTGKNMSDNDNIIEGTFMPKNGTLKADIGLFIFRTRSWGQFWSGPNPTTSIYNACGVKIYNATNSLARFRVRIIFFSDIKTLYPSTMPAL